MLRLWTAVDPQGSGKWVTQLPEGPLRDAALDSYLETVHVWAPDEGVKVALQLGAIAVGRVDQCVKRWMELDPTEATRVIGAADVPAVVKARWVGGK